MKTCLTFLASLCLAVAATANPGDLPRRTIDLASLEIPHETFTLDNGLRVIVHEDHSVPIVAVNLWYHVGSRNEEEGKTGFAHLFEHFFFNGSENYPHGFREAMDDLGANNRNGTTNTDRTNFFEDVPVSALERTLYLEADRLGFLAGNLSKEMLERERGVVKNEKRQGENRPYGQAFGRIVGAIYPASHPYSWSTIGRMEDLDAATLDDIRRWYETYYSPTNVVLSLAGDITVERARELVTRYFASIPPGPPLTRFESWIPRLERNIRDEMEDRVPQTRIYRVWHAPEWGAKELVHLQLLADILSGSKSAPLDRTLLYDRELATSVSASVWDKEIASNVLVIATVRQGVEAATVEAAIDKVIAALLKNGPTQAQLDRSKARIVARFTRGMERLGGFGGRSDILAESMTYGGDSRAYLEQLKMLESATAADVVAAGRKWLADAHHYTLTVRPWEQRRATQVELDRSVLPGIGDAPEVTFPKVQRARLENGLEVILLERHSTPLVNVTLAVDAGYASDPEGKEGLASLAGDLLDDGTKKRDTFAISDDLDAVGAQLFTSSDLDFSYLRLRALSGRLAGALEIMADVAINPSFPADMVALGRKNRLSEIAQEQADPRQMALRLMPTLVYPAGHSYARPVTGSGFEKSVSAISRDDLVGWHASWFRPGNASLVVAGDVTMDALLPIVRRTFGTWKDADAPEKNVGDASTVNRGKVFLVDKPGAPQSVITVARVTEPGGHELDLPLEVVMRNFGGMATSRLNRNLRLDKHWSYGTSGSVIDARGPRPFFVVAPVQTDKTVESMREIRREIDDLAGSRPVKGEEFASIMRNMLLRLPGRYETLSSLEGAAIDVLKLGYDDDYFAHYAERVRDLTEDDLAAAAGAFTDPDDMVWLIVGDLAVIEQAVREAGFGEVVRLDAGR